MFEFNEYVLDVARRELRRGNLALKLEPQVFDLLVLLIKNRGRVVSRDDVVAEIWGGRAISDSTLSSRVAAARRAVGDTGARQRVIRTLARKGFLFVAEVDEWRAPIADVSTGTLPEFTTNGAVEPVGLTGSPSIAVLPFQNSTGDPRQDYFSDGISEDLITALSHFGWLFVIARSSSFIYKDRTEDVRRIGTDLGVRYVLDGSVRRTETRVRISAHLVDAASATTIWADQFEGAPEEVFNLQDRVTESVVGAIGPKLEQAEMARARQKPTDHLDAYDLYLQGMSETYGYTEAGYRNALSLFRRSLDLDDTYADACAMAAWCYVTCFVNGWMTDPNDDRAEGIAYARRAIELGSDRPVPLCWGGFCHTWLAQDFDHGVGHVEKALAINPNLAAGWYLSGWLKVYQGEGDAALDRFGQALRRSPLDPLMFRAQAGIGHVHFFAGRYDEALRWVLKAVNERHNWLTAVRGAAACYAMSGRIAEAKEQVARLARLDPTRRISNLDRVLPMCRPRDRIRWSTALRRAGLPE